MSGLPSRASPRVGWTYDVFLSFRGKDTRQGFTSHLFAALKDAGINAFRDNETLHKGERMKPELLQAIEESRIAIIVFSTNYANSRWCLEELDKIMEVKEMNGQMVLPVFYDVKPSEVRKQTCSFARAFAEHEVLFEEERDRIVRWKTALTEAGHLSGWTLKDFANGDEAALIKEIVNTVLRELKDAYLDVPTFSVGLETRLERVKELLNLGSDEVLFIGICGREGIGKTAVAKAVYNRFFHAFEGRSFVANVSKNFRQPNDLVRFQEQLLSDIVKHESIKISSIEMGISVLKRKLRNKMVLIVLDDVSDPVQIQALAGERDWFRSGSRIIITTRDQCLLQELNGIYMVEQLDDNDALQLFSWHAFGDSHPKKEFMELSKEIASYCKGEPLALEFLGSFFSNRSLVEWRRRFVHLKKTVFDSLLDNRENNELPRIPNGLIDCSCLKCDSAGGVRQRMCLANVGQKKLMYGELLQDLEAEIAHKESSENARNIRMTLKTRQKKIQLQDPKIEISAMDPQATPSKHSGQHHQTISSVDESQCSIHNKVKLVHDKINMLGKNADVIVHGLQEHVRLSDGIRAVVMGKFCLGARVLRFGGIEKVFRELFSWEDEEKLLEFFQCHWSTSTIPTAAGLLFISTEKVAFWSERSVEVGFPGWESTKMHRKVKVPIRNIKAVSEVVNVETPSQKYINIVTVDDSDFLFTGFLNYQKALTHLRRAINQE